MRYLVIGVIGLLTGYTSMAQQLQTSSMYDLQGVFHNPAMAGTQKNNIAGATYRSQWSGISGSPKTATLFGSFKLPDMNAGISGYLYNDKTGPTSRTGLQLSMAKHIPLENNAKLSLGIEARLQQMSLDRAKLMETLGSDPAIGSSSNDFKFDAGFGIAYVSEKWQLGASVSQLVQSKLNFYSGNLSRSQQGRLYRHYYLHGAYKWNVDGTTDIIPNFLMIYLPNAPLEFQGGFRVEHNETFWWGLALRAKQSFMLTAGLHVNKKFTIGYSFDMYRTPLSIFDRGSNAHELMLRYNFLK